MSIISNRVLYSKGNNDECYTPAHAVKPILKYIMSYKYLHVSYRELIVWCPFDKKESEFVKQISLLEGVHVELSHIDFNQDFYNYQPRSWDIIVSNPPFTNKRQIFERALSFNKPFALLMSNTWLNDKYSKFVFKEANRDMQLLFFDKRVHFISSNGSMGKKTTFSSSYYCCDFLPKQIIIEELHEDCMRGEVLPL